MLGHKQRTTLYIPEIIVVKLCCLLGLRGVGHMKPKSVV